MFKAAQKIHARERLEECQLFAIPKTTQDWYDRVADRYRAVLEPPVMPKFGPIQQDATGKPVDEVAAKHAVFNMFTHLKGDGVRRGR